MLVGWHEEDTTCSFDRTRSTGDQHLGHLVVVVRDCEVQTGGTWGKNVVTVTHYLTSRPKYSSPSTLSKADLGKFLRRRRAIRVWIGLSQIMRTWSKDSPEERWLDVSAANWRKYQAILCTASSNRPHDPPKCALDHRSSSCSRRC